MTQAALFFLMLAALLFQGNQLAIPTKITPVPEDSFRGANTITLKATFAKGLVPPISAGPCYRPAFVIRIYDAKLVANEPGPRISPDATHPVTPYLQQTAAPYNPLDGSNPLTVEKTFEPFVLPAKKTARLSRLFLGLFHTCDIAVPKDIDESGTSIIYNDTLRGGYIGGVFFRRECRGGPCIYRPE